MLRASDWDFTGRPAWEPSNDREGFVPKWARIFSEKKPGEWITLYDLREVRKVRAWCKVNGIPHEVLRYLGGEWKVTRK